MWEVALTYLERGHDSVMLADLAEAGKTLRVVRAVREGRLSPCELYSHRTEHVLYALPIRTRNHFVNNAGRTIAKLLAKKRKDLQRSSGIGPGMMRELEDELVQLGLTLGGLVEE
ncbi:hypothetical protein GVX82_00220 [Patescibacteria group bacterium]|jgi:hypothetical protein|nr:hypothetical protein [Patescibacteria group bacterium]